METIKTFLTTASVSAIMNVISAIAIVVIGTYLANIITKLFVKTINKTSIEPTLVSFLKSSVNTALKFYVFFTAATKLGFSTGSLVAIIGTVGAAIALGFKDNLGSLVSGVMLLFMKPFKVGDFIEVAGQIGTVESIQVMATNLLTLDNRSILIPNNTIATSTIVNYSVQDNRRVDIDFNVSYQSDVELAKNLIMKAAMNHELVLKDPEPFVRVTEYGANAIVITTRVWTKNANYWGVKFDLLEAVKAEFDANGIKIPYQQIDVHVENK